MSHNRSSVNLRRTPPINPDYPLLLVALAAAASVQAAERSGKEAFQNAWMGRSVVVKRALYSVVYDERSHIVPIMKHKDRVSGLTVVTPAGTYYYQFDARRDSEDDLIDHDPNRIVSEMKRRYVRSERLDLGAVEDIEPLMLVRRPCRRNWRNRH
jgi:hypothetical protein